MKKEELIRERERLSRLAYDSLNVSNRSSNKPLTGYPSIDMPHTLNSTFFEKNPIIPSIDMVTILRLLSRKFRGNPSIDCDNLHATYQELLDDAHTLSLAYRELGVSKKDIVTLPLPSNYQAITSFLALNEIGAITTFVDTFSSKEEIIEFLNEYESPILVGYDMNDEDIKDIVKKSHVKNVINLSRQLTDSRDISADYRNTKSDVIDFHTLGSIAKHQRDLPHLPNKGSDDALILYTSGSTGKSKAVVLTNKNILAAQMYAGNTSHTENITGKKTMTCVPLRYPYGMVTSLLTSLLWGKEAIMTPGWDTNTVPYYYSKGGNIIFGSPAVLELTERFLPKDYDLSHVSHFISGGDFLTLERAARGYSFFHEHGNDTVEIGNGCGNAETVSIGSTPVGVPLKQSTAGKMLVGSTAMIIDKDISDEEPIAHPELLKEKKYNEIGELCIAGDHVFKEYFGEPYKTQCAKFVRNGKEYFRTGTLGFIDKDGYFTPTDRKSRFYIRSTGHKVYMDKIQRLLVKADERVLDTAVVKVPDENELYVNAAYIVLPEGVEPTDELKAEILEHLSAPILVNGAFEQLKEYEIPRYVEFVEEIPKLPGIEKPNYQLLEEQAQSLGEKQMVLLRKPKVN